MLAKEPDKPKFYMTCENRERIREAVNDLNSPVMQNAMLYHNDSNFREFAGYDTPTVIDSGGYSAMDQFGGDFPWTVKEYHKWLAETYDDNEFDWAAVMDLACEPAFDDDMTIKERQDQTLENTLTHLELEPDYPLLPVLQGRTINQWLEYHDRLQDHGIATDYVGVGTLCRQSSSRKIAEIERALRNRSKIKAMHGFGVKISSFAHGARFETADSKAWAWVTRYGMKYTSVNENPPGMKAVQYEDSAQAHNESFRAYRKRAAWLHQQAQVDKSKEQTDVLAY